MQPGHTVRNFTKQRGRRVIVSTAAVVALVVGTVGTAVAAAASNDGDIDTDADNGAGPAVDAVYQPCSENFGLGKVVEIVVEVDGSVPTPPLTFPDDVSVVTTFDPGSGPVTCIPEPVTNALWASNSVWGLLGISAPVGNYVFLPFTNEQNACSDPQTMRLVGQPAGYIVTVGHASVMATPGIFCGADAVDAVNTAAEAIMSPTAFTALTAYNSDPSSCDPTPSPALQAAANALEGALHAQFHTLFLSHSASATACDTVGIAYTWFGYQTLYDLEVGRQAVFELTTPPAPTTTTTTTPPAAAPAPTPVVVAPAFTG